MTIFDVLTMIGGLCLFLFGMTIMGESLERCPDRGGLQSEPGCADGLQSPVCRKGLRLRKKVQPEKRIKNQPPGSLGFRAA